MLFRTTRRLYIHGWSKGYQSTARSVDIGKYLMGVKIRLSQNCDIDGEEIIFELPDFVHLLVHVCKVSITIQLLF